MNDPSLNAQASPPKTEPPFEPMAPQLTPPVVEATGMQAIVEATGVQAGGPPPSTVVKPSREFPQVPGYEFIKRLGKGGMGVVWLAKDLKANRLIAFKQTISDELSPGERERFRVEAQAMAKLAHPNIVQVFDVDEFDYRPYFTMEYCAGGSLHEYLDRKPQPPKVAAKIVEQLARGMQHAHKNGIIHRDLKPANVLVTKRFDTQGNVSTAVSVTSEGSEDRQKAFQVEVESKQVDFLKITDFGLAKNTETSQGMTQTGDVMGTPSYMAPEQGSSTKKAGAQADVWSLGIILYEAITGSLPFVGADRYETFLNVCEKDPVPPSEKVKCPRDLETICLKCLRKDAKDRYATAQALADDLRAFLEDRSISARPMGRLEKGYKWVKKNPGISLLLSLFVLTLISATLISLWFANESAKFAKQSAKDADDAKKALKKADDALKEANEQKKRRTRALVGSLWISLPPSIPLILKDLEAERQEAFPQILEVWELKWLPLRSRWRAGLGLLHMEPDLVREELVKAMFVVDDPEELVVIRDTLKPFMASQADSLWQQLEDKSISNDQRLRLLAALAAFDEKNPKWTQVGDTILQPWLSDNPLFLRTWTDALRPVRLSLIPSVQKVYRGEQLNELKYVAANILADYASDQPEVLASLIQTGDDRQFNTIFPVLERHREKAIARLKVDIAKQPQPEWNDPPLKAEWLAVPKEVRAEIEKAGGMVEERFALVQSLPLERLQPLVESMSKSGYRPQRIRPYEVKQSIQVTVLWQRDGKAVRLGVGLTEAEVRDRTVAEAKEKYQPLDVAAYREGKEFRFVVLWEAVEKLERRELILAMPNEGYTKLWQSYRDPQMSPLGKQVLGIGTSEWRVSEVWSARSPGFNWNYGIEASELGNLLGDPSKIPSDLGLSPRLEAERVRIGEAVLSLSPWSWLGHRASGQDLQRSQYSLLFLPRAVETEVLWNLSGEQHRGRCRELVAKGYRPSSVSGSESEIASVWERPLVRDEQRLTVAKLQSSSGMALARLGEPNAVWPILQSSPFPEARSRAIHRFVTTGVEAKVLFEQLQIEKDVGIRRALILSLGQYRESQIPAVMREEIITLLLKWYREDGDTGIHGAIDWLLRHDKDGLEDRPLKWGQAEKLAEIDKSFSGRIEELPKERNWVVNGEGQTFAILDSREAFLMSSPVTEKDRFDSNELQHWRKLDRKFGISTKAVTVEQFERFKKANPVVTHTYTKKYAPESACPQVSVTWYEAIAYCRWLSEEEGIPETEWVYPLTVKEIMAAAAENKALMMPQDYLKRKGYRLLSEAEWEYSARSGTQSAYHFGDSVELLREYGWYTKNTNDAQSFPVGEKKPNEWGLFDMTGNSYSWVQDRFLRYPNGSRLKPGLDVEDKQSITDNEGRVLRGGSFLELASFLRSSVRADGRPSSRNVIIGFRLSRTFD